MTTASPLRYMGSKVELVGDLHELLGTRKTPYARVVDLFAGTGTVASSLNHPTTAVAGDVMGFALCVTRSRVLPLADDRPNPFMSVLRVARAIDLGKRSRMGDALRQERRALSAGFPALGDLIDGHRHVGNDDGLRGEAQASAVAGSYRLVELYFARGYFSTRQASALDSFRQAIDEVLPENARGASTDVWERCEWHDFMLAIWLCAASAMTNSPGHAAQFLKGGSPASHSRVARSWSIDPWMSLIRAAKGLDSGGSPARRQGNRVIRGEASDVARRSEAGVSEGTLVYADPPYTKDHYSRLYHMLETLYLYDYPDSCGSGRMRSDRFASPFSYKASAHSSIAGLAEDVLSLGAEFLLSYPAKGLADVDRLRSHLGGLGTLTERKVAHRHSSLGARHGSASAEAVEHLLLVVPR